MPNPHYQRVLEQDQALPAPLRILSRAMSSWWTILVLSLFVVGYVFFAHAPIGGRYVWQWRLFDTTQHAVVTWWPLLAAAWLLAVVLIWSVMRRLPWRIDNLGMFVVVLGLVIILISQSWAFRSQRVGIAAVPLSESTGNTQADALSLNYTTRYGDTHDRVLVVMAGGGAPITIPLTGIPRWNDATGDAMPTLKLHDHPKLASIIGYGTRITTTAYIADGKLIEKQNNSVAPKITPKSERDLTALPYPSNALLALEITTDLEDGGTQTTTAWLPFEPEGTDSLVPEHFFQVEGLGSVGLAFRPASKKLPFALGGVVHFEGRVMKSLYGTLYVSDADTKGRLLQPAAFDFSVTGTNTHSYSAIDEQAQQQQYQLRWVNLFDPIDTHTLIAVSTNTTNPFILAGMITFVLGVILDRLLDWLSTRPTTPKPTPADAPDAKSPNPNAAL